MTTSSALTAPKIPTKGGPQGGGGVEEGGFSSSLISAPVAPNTPTEQQQALTQELTPHAPLQPALSEASGPTQAEVFYDNIVNASTGKPPLIPVETLAAIVTEGPDKSLSGEEPAPGDAVTLGTPLEQPTSADEADGVAEEEGEIDRSGADQNDATANGAHDQSDARAGSGSTGDLEASGQTSAGDTDQRGSHQQTNPNRTGAGATGNTHTGTGAPTGPDAANQRTPEARPNFTPEDAKEAARDIIDKRIEDLNKARAEGKDLSEFKGREETLDGIAALKQTLPEGKLSKAIPLQGEVKDRQGNSVTIAKIAGIRISGKDRLVVCQIIDPSNPQNIKDIEIPVNEVLRLLIKKELVHTNLELGEIFSTEQRSLLSWYAEGKEDVATLSPEAKSLVEEFVKERAKSRKEAVEKQKADKLKEEEQKEVREFVKKHPFEMKKAFSLLREGYQYRRIAKVYSDALLAAGVGKIKIGDQYQDITSDQAQEQKEKLEVDRGIVEVRIKELRNKLDKAQGKMRDILQAEIAREEEYLNAFDAALGMQAKGDVSALEKARSEAQDKETAKNKEIEAIFDKFKEIGIGGKVLNQDLIDKIEKIMLNADSEYEEKLRNAIFLGEWKIVGSSAGTFFLGILLQLIWQGAIKTQSAGLQSQQQGY